MSVNYYEHHLGDFAKDAGYLSMIREGAYRRLIDIYYNREKPLPADIKECFMLARATSGPERDAVKYVLEQFFVLEKDGYHQRRCDREIARFRSKSQAAKASANARWGNRQNDANAMRTHNGRKPNASNPHMPIDCEVHAPNHQSPVTNPQTPDSRLQNFLSKLTHTSEVSSSVRAPKTAESEPEKGSVCGSFTKMGGEKPYANR